MSDSSLPILLNAGLDYVTPPLLAKPGALIDCLNYEMTATVGYRRIDGYERYDGWTDGGVASFFVVPLVANVPADQPQLVQGSLLGRVDTLTNVTDYFAVVVGVEGTNVSYVPFRRTDTINNNQLVFVLTPAGNSYFFTAANESVSGLTLSGDAKDYTQKLRDFSEQLRSAVQDHPTAIAGINYSRDRLYYVVNAPYLYLTSSSTMPPIGALVRWKGAVWRLMAYYVSTPGTPPTYNISLTPVKVANVVNDNFQEVDTNEQLITNYGPVTAAPIYDNAQYAYIVYARNPYISNRRGYTALKPAYSFLYTNGKSVAAGPTSYISGTGTYWAINNGVAIKVSLANYSKSGGSWTDGTAAGRASVTPVEVITGTRDYLVAGDVLHNAFPTTANSAVMTISSAMEVAKLAGTAALYAYNTRYQFGTYNFYASSSLKQMFGTNGVTRAFWADQTSYGNIYTQENAALDNPKYLSMHARNNLVLGFADGSVQLSVGGEPYNFEGVQGAVEISTGDDVTGLLEATGDSTLIFGRRSISRLTGTSSTDYANKTVVANAGAYDYTAVNVGGIPVFTDPSGISTLEQSNAYGDFVGQRSTYSISTWLTPRLVPTQDSIELGGVACAMPVREKMQYRLFLNSGEVVSLCFSGEGPKCMVSEYAIQESDARSVRVPLAWSSEVADSGKEMLHVVWDRKISERGQNGVVGSLPLTNRVYRLDYGWGFDGRAFNHYFDLAHTFVENGSRFFQVEQLRLYGQGYGVATLNVRSSSIEDDFDMSYNTRLQDISMPPEQKYFYDGMRNVTSIIDHANWGLGTKFRINNSINENTLTTEPSHVCQVLVMYMNTEGVGDK